MFPVRPDNKFEIGKWPVLMNILPTKFWKNELVSRHHDGSIRFKKSNNGWKEMKFCICLHYWIHPLQTYQIGTKKKISTPLWDSCFDPKPNRKNPNNQDFPSFNGIDNRCFMYTANESWKKFLICHRDQIVHLTPCSSDGQAILRVGKVDWYDCGMEAV